MNFVSHFYLDRDVCSSMYMLGVGTPDLLSSFKEGIRLRQSRLPLILESDVSEDQIQFYNGVIRHFEVDRLFHSSEFFLRETRHISALLKSEFSELEIERVFFVAHITLELLMDRILILDNEEMLKEYYAHYTHRTVIQAARFTEWVCRKILPTYEAYLRKVATRQYLYNYKDISFILMVMEQIFRKVGLKRISFLGSTKISLLLNQYQDSLAAKLPLCMFEIRNQLCKV